MCTTADKTCQALGPSSVPDAHLSRKQRDKMVANPSSNAGTYKEVLVADEDWPACMGSVPLPTASSCCPDSGVSADVPCSIVWHGDRTALLVLIQGWNRYLGLAHTSLLIEFGKFTLKTVSNCEMQLLWVGPAASPETCGKQPPPKWCLCLQQTLPGKRGSQPRCPSLFRALAPPDCHTVLVLLMPLDFKETFTISGDT